MIARRSLVLALSLILLVQVLPSTRAHAEIEAHSWIIYDLDNELVLDEERMNQRVPMASLTKVMTGLLVVENLSLFDRITIVEEDLVGEAAIWVEADDEYSVRTLLYGMMMRSGNDAASALARAVGGSFDRESPAARARFIDMMNQRARELGMHNTSFRNPHGLDNNGHYSTPRDLVRLTEAVLGYPQLLTAFGAETFSSEGLTFTHTNQLPGLYDGVIGGKTGWTTDAGLCLIQVVEQNGKTLIVVLLGSTFERWYPDAIELLDYGFALPDRAHTPVQAMVVFEWWRDRTDGPIQRGQVERSWLWGPAPLSGVRSEPYVNADGGWRRVQYFDKGRMEINIPDAPVNSGWYVTGGHLAMELISGRRQMGDSDFIHYGSARIPVAGDPNSPGPTYAHLNNLLDIREQPLGEPVTRRLSRDGHVLSDSSLARFDVRAQSLDSPTLMPIADVFDEYLSQVGPVVHQGRTVEMELFNPRFALVGLPVMEPVWTRVPVGGDVQDVLVQCFERRCLTYTPTNPEGWQVEMGNIGQHYLQWHLTSQFSDAGTPGRGTGATNAESGSRSGSGSKSRMV